MRYRKHVRPDPLLRCTADVVFSRERLAIFVDGCFWHGCPQHGRKPARNSGYWSAKLDRNAARDARNNALLEENGWTVVRAWEHEDPRDVAARIEGLLGAIRRGEASAR
jgi:DNA mismatch endonuclease (patch repair protein)